MSGGADCYVERKGGGGGGEGGDGGERERGKKR